MNGNNRIERKEFVTDESRFKNVRRKSAADRDKPYIGTEKFIYKRHIGKRVGVACVINGMISDFNNKTAGLTEI